MAILLPSLNWRQRMALLAALLSFFPRAAWALDIPSRMSAGSAARVRFSVIPENPVPIITISIKDTLFRVMLDTGSNWDLMLRESAAQRLKLPPGDDDVLEGYGSVKSGQIDRLRLKGASDVNDIVLVGLSVRLLPDAFLDQVFDKRYGRIDGILGVRTLLASQVVQLDYPNKELSVLRPGRKFQPGSAQPVPLSLLDERPAITVTNASGKKFTLLIDTGSYATILDSTFDPLAFSRSTEQDTISLLSHRNVPIRKATTQLNIGALTFPDQRVFLSEKPPLQLLGNNFLLDKVITFDYKNRVAYIDFERR